MTGLASPCSTGDADNVGAALDSFAGGVAGVQVGEDDDVRSPGHRTARALSLADRPDRSGVVLQRAVDGEARLASPEFLGGRGELVGGAAGPQARVLRLIIATVGLGVDGAVAPDDDLVGHPHEEDRRHLPASEICRKPLCKWSRAPDSGRQTACELVSVSVISWTGSGGRTPGTRSPCFRGCHQALLPRLRERPGPARNCPQTLPYPRRLLRQRPKPPGRTVANSPRHSDVSRQTKILIAFVTTATAVAALPPAGRNVIVANVQGTFGPRWLGRLRLILR